MRERGDIGEGLSRERLERREERGLVEREIWEESRERSGEMWNGGTYPMPQPSVLTYRNQNLIRKPRTRRRRADPIHLRGMCGCLRGEGGGRYGVGFWYGRGHCVLHFRGPLFWCDWGTSREGRSEWARMCEIEDLVDLCECELELRKLSASALKSTRAEVRR